MTEPQKISVTIDKNTPFVLPTTEIIGAIMATTATADLQRAAATPTIITEELGLAIPENMQISLVENSDKVMHLALPYYESIDGSYVQLLDDAHLELTTGGEIVCIAVGAVVGAKIAAVLGAKLMVTSVAAGAVSIPLITYAATAGTIAGGAVVGGVVGAGVAATVAGVSTGIAAGAGAFDK